MKTSIKTSLFGYQLLLDPLLNKGTAFSQTERKTFDLHGILPDSVTTLEEQLDRRLQVLRTLSNDLQKYVFMRELQDNNETLFYAVLTQNLEELLPIVYTPTVGEGCQHFSRLFRKPRGLYLSVPHQTRMEAILSNAHFDSTEVIVVTDGERILGLGDLGAGGMGIPIGKLSLYSACAGLYPATTLPIFLDVGTNNEECLNDPFYIGWRHERLVGNQYDEFIETFVNCLLKRFPHVLLQWEDFAKNNATRLLEKYRDKICSFNDDIQGTAAVLAATLLSSMHVSKIALRDQKIVILGAGSAGTGIADFLKKLFLDAGLKEQEAEDRIVLVDVNGLLWEGISSELLPFQRAFVKDREFVQGWKKEAREKQETKQEKQGAKKERQETKKETQTTPENSFSLLDVIQNFKPTVLIGVSGQAGVFTKTIVEAMAAGVDRPTILPLSNPSTHAEAKPQEIYDWSQGRAIVGVGSPFDPIIRRDNSLFNVDQTNNSYIFPGLGLGILAVRSKMVSDKMFLAAAKTLSALSPARENNQANLLPSVTHLREVSFKIAQAVARTAWEEGLAGVTVKNEQEIDLLIQEKIWEPRYVPYERI